MGKPTNMNKRWRAVPKSVEKEPTKQSDARKIQKDNLRSTHLLDDAKIMHNAEGIDPETLDERGD